MLVALLILGLLQPTAYDQDTQPQQISDYGQTVQVARSGWDLQPQQINGATTLQGSYQTLQDAYSNATF